MLLLCFGLQVRDLSLVKLCCLLRYKRYSKYNGIFVIQGTRVKVGCLNQFVTVKVHKPLWLTSNRGPSILGSCQVATLIKCKSRKAIRDSFRDPRQAFFPSLGLIVSWLLAVT